MSENLFRTLLIISKFFKQDSDKEKPVTRTPYFENSSASKYFSPLFKRSIYALKDEGLYMKYYLDFDMPYFNSSRTVNGALDAKEAKLYYTYQNAFHNKQYLFQHFLTSVETQGTIVINLKNDKSMFIKKLKIDMEEVMDFSFGNTLFYDDAKNSFIGIAHTFYESFFNSEEELERIKSIVPPKYFRILVRDEKLNPVLIFYKLRSDILN